MITQPSANIIVINNNIKSLSTNNFKVRNTLFKVHEESIRTFLLQQLEPGAQTNVRVRVGVAEGSFSLLITLHQLQGPPPPCKDMWETLHYIVLTTNTSIISSIFMNIAFHEVTWLKSVVTIGNVILCTAPIYSTFLCKQYEKYG